jgi:hypothetical protein
MEKAVAVETLLNRNAVRFPVLLASIPAIVLAFLGLRTPSTNLLGRFLFLTGIVYAAGTAIVTDIHGETFWEAKIRGNIRQSEQRDRSFWKITVSMMALGLAIGYSSLRGIASTLFALLPCMIDRTHIEDRLLAERFGKQFNQYCLKTKRLLPGSW